MRLKSSLPALSAACAAVLLCVPLAAPLFRLQGALFALYALAYILLPGRLVCRPLRGALRLAAPAAFLLHFFSGTALLFAQYYLLNIVGTLLPLRFLPPVAALAELILLVRDLKSGAPFRERLSAALRKASDHHLFFWVLCAAVWYAWFLTGARYPAPASLFSSDFQWHMGNIYTLSVPGFQDIRVMGMTFRYHYFSDLFFAGGRIALGLVPYNCAVYFPALLTPFLTVGAFYALFGRAVSNKSFRAFLSAAALFAFPLFGDFNDLTYQALTNINAVGLALPCGILLLLVIGGMLEDQPNNLRSCIPRLFAVAVLMALLTGFKGPFALCVLGGLAGWTLYGRLKRLRPGAAWYGVLAAASLSFFALWAALLRGGMNESYVLSNRLFAAVGHAAVLSKGIIALGDGLFARLVFLPLQYLVITGIFGIPYVLALVRVVRSLFAKRPPAERFFTLCALGALASLGAYYLFDLTGRSQNYFLYFAVPLMAYCGAREVALRWRGRAGQPPKKSKRVLIAASVLCAGVTLFSAMHPMTDRTPVSYTADEMRAINWILENTPPDALLAVNRHETFYLVSGYTGRRVYLEGVAYAKNSGVTGEMLAQSQALNDEMFRIDTSDARRLEIARELDIDYVAQWINAYVDPSLYGVFGEGFELCYYGSDVVLWRVLPK